jgi:hypothetical protein
MQRDGCPEGKQEDGDGAGRQEPDADATRRANDTPRATEIVETVAEVKGSGGESHQVAEGHEGNADDGARQGRAEFVVEVGGDELSAQAGIAILVHVHDQEAEREHTGQPLKLPASTLGPSRLLCVLTLREREPQAVPRVKRERYEQEENFERADVRAGRGCGHGVDEGSLASECPGVRGEVEQEKSAEREHTGQRVQFLRQNCPVLHSEER